MDTTKSEAQSRNHLLGSLRPTTGRHALNHNLQKKLQSVATRGGTISLREFDSEQKGTCHKPLKGKTIEHFQRRENVGERNKVLSQ